MLEPEEIRVFEDPVIFLIALVYNKQLFLTGYSSQLAGVNGPPNREQLVTIVQRQWQEKYEITLPKEKIVTTSVLRRSFSVGPDGSICVQWKLTPLPPEKEFDRRSWSAIHYLLRKASEREENTLPLPDNTWGGTFQSVTPPWRR